MTSRKRVIDVKVLFTPDIFKYDEEFVIEGKSLARVIKKLKKGFMCNSVLSVNILSQHGLIYLGLLKIEEGKEPEWVMNDSITLFAETEQLK